MKQKTAYRKRVPAERAKEYRRFAEDLGVPALVASMVEIAKHHEMLLEAGLTEHASGASTAHFSTILILTAAKPATREEAELKVAFLAPLCRPAPGPAFADAAMCATAVRLERERWGLAPS